jgi:hypothetical protein
MAGDQRDKTHFNTHRQPSGHRGAPALLRVYYRQVTGAWACRVRAATTASRASFFTPMRRFSGLHGKRLGTCDTWVFFELAFEGG